LRYPASIGWLGLLLAAMSLTGRPEASGRNDLAFLPSSIQFGEVTPGDSAVATIVVYNGGVDTITVNGSRFAAVDGAPFQVSPGSFLVAPDDTVQLAVVYRPTVAGRQVNALILDAVADDQALSPPPLVGLSGLGAGPALEAEPPSLRFYSRNVGTPDTSTTVLRSTGSDTVRILSFDFSDPRFTGDLDSLTLAPGEDRLLQVIYTPSDGPAVSASMVLDVGSEPTVAPPVDLAASATPINTASARISLVRLDTTAYPQVGDTIVVRLDLRPGGDSVEGVEVFLAYDSSSLMPTDSSLPVSPPTQAISAVVVANATLESIEGIGAVHYSLLFKNLREDREIGNLRLVVSAPMAAGTQVRVINEPPWRNSSFFTPALIARSLPGENRVILGNAAPVLRPFPLLSGEEDRSANIALAGLVSDAESSVSDLVWTLVVDSADLTVRVDELDPSVGPVARFVPLPDRFGVFTATATVTDPGGASDTALVIVDITQANDPPLAPVYEQPADQAQSLAPPLLFRWTAEDPDPFDRLTFSFELGASPDEMTVTASDLIDSEYELPGIVAGTVYYWRVVARDSEGANAQGEIRSFTSAPDTDPPALASGPILLSVGETDASLTWRTDEVTRSQVRYGPASTFQDSVGVLEHVVEGLLRLVTTELTGLTSGTVYAYEVLFADVAGNSNRSATATFETAPSTGQTAVGDFNGDRAVTFEDFILFANAYGKASNESGYMAEADLDGNGLIDFSDFVAFTTIYGTDYGTP
jgi:hypothetical protein